MFLAKLDNDILHALLKLEKALVLELASRNRLVADARSDVKGDAIAEVVYRAIHLDGHRLRRAPQGAREREARRCPKATKGDEKTSASTSN